VIRSNLRGLSLAAAFGLAAALNVTAAAAEDFYKGKRLTVVVGFTPGGGYDAYARLIARHYGRLIPGEPAVVVQNMPGAGSLTAVKYLSTTAPQDGTIMTAFNPGLIAQSLSTPQEVDIDFTKETRFVGSATSEVRICYAWHASGVKTVEDLLKRDQFIVGATTKGSSSYINSSLLKNLLGAKIKHVVGYPGSAEQRLAIEQGELEGDCGAYGSIPEEWIRDKKIFPLVKFSRASVAGMPPMPAILDLVKTTEQKQILNLLLSASEIGRPYVVGPKVPAERLEILRRAFDRMIKDKEFLEEAEKTNREVIGPMSGEEVEAALKDIYATPKEIVAKAGAAIE
jgi:tripartite-type tricarboxylate transporter receptor subunit TctC